MVVGPFTYTIHADANRMNQKCRDRDDDLRGHVDLMALTIDLDPTFAPATIAESLLHEVLHTITHVTGIDGDLDDDREEALVNRLSPALLDTLRRNPTLVAYLTT